MDSFQEDELRRAILVALQPTCGALDTKGFAHAVLKRGAMVEGIGGVFIVADDAARLAAWYRDVLGIQAEPMGEAAYFHEFRVREAHGERRLTRTVWAIFQREPDKKREPESFTVNYRVDDLAALLERLEAAGIPIEKAEDYDYGRFAWIRDPEGNKIELFEDLNFDP